MPQRNCLPALVLLGLASQSFAYGSTAEDEHIRQIVENMLKEKDQKNERLEARIRQLEQAPKGSVVVLQNQEPTHQAKTAMPEPGQKSATVVVQNQIPAPHAKTTTTEPVKTATITKTEPTVKSTLQALEKKIDDLKEAASDKGLEMGAFFDVNAKTGNSTDQTFGFGSLELDLDYHYNGHFGASAALVLCGNSSNADYAAPPAIFCGNSGAGGLSGGNTMAGIAVGFIDYNVYDDTIPPRGRIFNKDGLHIRAGRFDIPFGTDYQNFANTDRVTVTAPLTTSYMQLGGYNGDGVNSFGARGRYQYSLFWTDAMYGDDGHAIGGRVGMFLG